MLKKFLTTAAAATVLAAAATFSVPANAATASADLSCNTGWIYLWNSSGHKVSWRPSMGHWNVPSSHQDGVCKFIARTGGQFVNYTSGGYETRSIVNGDYNYNYCTSGQMGSKIDAVRPAR